MRRRFPDYEALYAARGWRMFDSIERVYVNARARARPRLGARATTSPTRSTALAAGEDVRSPLAREVGAKGYHAESTGPYTVR